MLLTTLLLSLLPSYILARPQWRWVDISDFPELSREFGGTQLLPGFSSPNGEGNVAVGGGSSSSSGMIAILPEIHLARRISSQIANIGTVIQQVFVASQTDSSTSQTGVGTAGGSNIVPVSGSFTAQFTRYGLRGSDGHEGNCVTNTNACGKNPRSGFTAAASEFLYFSGADGTGPYNEGQPGAICGTCWALKGTQRAAAGRSTVVLIDNDCGRGPNTKGKDCNCCQSSFTDLNSANAQVVIDLCTDSGASVALLGSDMAEGGGSAQQVSCDEWCGVLADGTKMGPPGCELGGATGGQFINAPANGTNITVI
ncbi:MAG: hypothetical protein Q9167_003043 [Letrouitia subvulpina]